MSTKKKPEAQKLVAGKEPEVTEADKAKAEAAAKAEAEAKAKADAKAKKEAEAEAKKKTREDEKAKKKAERESAKAAKSKDKPARETPAHMAKVDKYAASLPTLSEAARSVFTQAESLSSGELNVLSAHISLLARKRATASATTVKLQEGDRVRIHSGIDTRFIGKEGVVTRCQRIRIFVKVPGFSKDAYLFASNVELLESTKIDVSDDAPEATEGKTATG